MDVWIDQVQFIPDVTKNFRIPLVAHITVNCTPVSPLLIRFMQRCDYLVAPSKFVYDEIRKAGLSGDIYYIPHGVDLNTYKPLPKDSIDEMKKRLGVENKDFIAITVMRNKGQLQKNYPKLFEAWRMFVEQDPKIREKSILLCLTDPLEQGAVRLDALRDRYGIRDCCRFVWAKIDEETAKVKMTQEGDINGMVHCANYNFDAEEMAKFYNICDVYIQATHGESFGLPILDSMACGKPQIMIDFSTGRELVGDPKTGILVPIKMMLATPVLSDIAFIESDDLMKAINTIYSDDKLRKECGLNALKFAKDYSWDKIIPMWDKLFRKVEEDLLNTNYNKGILGV